MEKLMSLREFAKYARVSPQRLLGLVNEGKINRVNGFIPMSEYEYFIREELLKGISRQNMSVLYIQVNVSDESSINNIEQIKNMHDDTTAIYINSISNLIANIYNKSLVTFNSSDEKGKQLEVLQLKHDYMIAIIKEFVKRLDDAVIRLLAKVITTKKVSIYPMISIYEMLLFDKLYTDTGVNEEELREVLNTVMNFHDEGEQEEKSSKRYKEDSLVNIFNNSFISIISALNMRKPSGESVIKKSDLTLEFIKAVRDLSDETLITNNHPLYNYMNADMLFGSTSSSREFGADAEKIKNQVLNRKHSFNKTATIGSYVSNGIYSVRNITDDMDINELQKLIGDIQNGFYKHVVILSDEETAGTYLRESFYMAVRGMALTKHIELEFSEGKVNALKYFKEKKKSSTDNE